MKYMRLTRTNSLKPLIWGARGYTKKLIGVAVFACFLYYLTPITPYLTITNQPVIGRYKHVGACMGACAPARGRVRKMRLGGVKGLAMTFYRQNSHFLSNPKIQLTPREG